MVTLVGDTSGVLAGMPSDHTKELRLGPCYSEMTDSLSLNREVGRGVLCHDISSPAAILLGDLIRLIQQLHIRELIAGDANKFKGPVALLLLIYSALERDHPVPLSFFKKSSTLWSTGLMPWRCQRA